MPRNKNGGLRSLPKKVFRSDRKLLLLGLRTFSFFATLDGNHGCILCAQVF
jgi:hypothetical protein